MKKSYRRPNIPRLWQEKQASKQVFSEKYKNIKKRQQEIDALISVDDEQDKIIEKHDIIGFLEEVQSPDFQLLQDILDRTGHALQISVNNYNNAFVYLSKIDEDQRLILNEVSSSSASGGTISSGVWDLAQIPDIDSQSKLRIEEFTVDNRKLDRRSLQGKLDSDLGQFDPELVERRKHAWNDYNSGVDQALRDSCTHLRELIYYFLNEFCKTEKITKCDWYDNSKKEPQRRDQINYLLEEILDFPDTSDEYGHRFKLIKKIIEVIGRLSSLAHFGPTDRDKVHQLIIDTENLLILLFSKGLKPFGLNN